eukprot:7670163-Pyramimonas_sp.AAC.1
MNGFFVANPIEYYAYTMLTCSTNVYTKKQIRFFSTSDSRASKLQPRLDTVLMVDVTAWAEPRARIASTLPLLIVIPVDS